MTQHKLTMDIVKENMNSKYTLVYTDYTTNLNESIDTIIKCIESKSARPLHDYANQIYYCNESESVDNIIEGIKEVLQESDYDHEDIEQFFAEYEEQIREEIYIRDDTDIATALVDNTRDIAIRVELHSNYDCINSHYFEGTYHYKDSYFGAMVDALNLNPRKVQEYFRDIAKITTAGYFPNIKKRNGNEWVTYEQFATEIINSSTPANLLTFVATIKLQDLLYANFNLKEITIPKGNYCGIFSSNCGSGSLLEMELQKDITLKLNDKPYDYFNLCIDSDKSYGYSIDEVYGVIRELYGKSITIISNVA